MEKQKNKPELVFIPFKQSAIYSLPLRMPGQTLQVQASKPKFQVTLRGGGDDRGIFEYAQYPTKWQSNTLHYALARTVYDILFEEPIQDEEKTIKLSVNYSILTPDEKTQNIRLSLCRWDFEFVPRMWYKLPKSDSLVSKIFIRGSGDLKREDVLPPKYRIVVAGVPLRFLAGTSSPEGVFDLRTVPAPDAKGVLVNGALDFSQVFGVWVVFAEEPDCELEIAYEFVN